MPADFQPLDGLELVLNHQNVSMFSGMGSGLRRNDAMILCLAGYPANANPLKQHQPGL